MISWRLSLGLGLFVFSFLAVKSLQQKQNTKENLLEETSAQAVPPANHLEHSYLISESYFIRLKPYFTFPQTGQKTPQDPIQTHALRLSFNGESLPLSEENKKNLSEGKETLVGPLKNLYSGLNEIFIEIPPKISSPLPLLFLRLEILKEGQRLLKTGFWGYKKDPFMYATHIYL